MPKYRIKAYLLNEEDRRIADKAIAAEELFDSEITDGFVIGVVEVDAIANLKKEGLAVSIVEKLEEGPKASTERPEILYKSQCATNFNLYNEKQDMFGVQELRPTKKVYNRSLRRQFYIVRFHGPITEDRSKELKHLGVKPLERLTRNRYTFELLPSEVDALSKLKFVHFVRLYEEGDTLRVPNTTYDDKQGSPDDMPRKIKVDESTPRSKRRTCLYNVRLHRIKDMAAVAKWLSGKKRKPLWKRDDTLQVALLENSRTLQELAARREVASVEQVEAPKLFDDHARAILGIVKGEASIGLTGKNEIIGIADTGIDDSHPDLAGRIIGTSTFGRPGDHSDPEGHGTHVAGCVAGNGKASKGEILGAAPKAEIFFQSVLDENGGLGGLPNDIGELLDEAYKKGARIHNNSWGAFSFAGYTGTSLDVDKYVAAHPDMLVVIAAGNDGISVPRNPGANINSDKGFVDWPSVAAPATAKNGLTVGASRSSRPTGGLSELTWNDAWPDKFPDPPIGSERISSDQECLAAFSSRGPSDDLRIKPDVVAPGTDIAAARSKDAPMFKFWGAYPKNDKYGFMGGTSMAAPYVAGCAALVREWYRTAGSWETPSAALLKATLINGTRRLSGTDAIAKVEGNPNFHQGFGRVDMSNTVPNPLAPNLKLAFDDTWKYKDRMLSDYKRMIRYSIEADAGEQLRVCLAWTDPPNRAVQSGLVLVVRSPDKQTGIGNSGAASVLKISGAQRDPNNNVQIVRFDKSKKGIYVIAISVGTPLVGPQSFALVVTGALRSDLKLIK